MGLGRPHYAAARPHHPRTASLKKQADRNRTERSFELGESVLLKLQPYAQSSVANRPCAKLAYKYFGPFKIVDKIGKLAYKLDLPVDSRIHPVFHVSQLKPFTPNYTPVFSELPRPPDLASHDAEPMEILERRMVKRGSSAIVQIKVKWSDAAASSTWEDYETLRRRFPQACVWQEQEDEAEEHQVVTEDGARSEDAGNVTPASPA